MISSLLSPDVTYSEKVLRTVVVYVSLLAGARLGGACG
jgi:hypothetical protein